MSKPAWEPEGHAGHGSPCERQPDGSCSGEADTCRTIDVDGEPVLVRGSQLTDQERELLAEVVRAGKTMFLTEQAAIVQQIVDLYRTWRAAGPPPIGTSISRWWDARILELEQTLARRHGAVTKTSDTAEQARERWALRMVGILADLDRCQHGRHEGDPCGSCGGLSTGNPYLGPGRVIGHSVHGNPIVLPTRDHKTDPAAWRHTTTKDST